MKIYTLIITALFLSACSSQNAMRFIPDFESDEQMQCARECEYTHGGAVRGCNQGRSGATRGATFVEQCVERAYSDLRICYRSCDQ